jgi:hypothetical protein
MGNHHRNRRSVAALSVGALLALAPSCSSLRKPEGLKRADSLSSDIEAYAADLEGLKAEMQETLAAHDRVVGSSSGDFLTPYVRYRDGIENLTRRQEDLPSRIASIEKSGRNLFIAWEADLQRFTDDSIRNRCAKRLDETRKRYEGLLANHEKAMTSLSEILTTMRDHALFWAHDLNADSARALERDAAKLAEASDRVGATIDEVLAAASTYRRSVAMRPEGPAILSPRN